MTFKLDPVSALGAIEKAKGWQGQQFPGSASPMNFSSGIVARRGMDRAIQDIGPWKERPFSQQIILPPTGVFSSDAVGNIAGGHFDAFGQATQLGREGLDGLGRKHRAEEYYKFAKELARKRNKKRGGGLWGSIGRLGGTVLGTMVGGPVGGSIGGQIGGYIGGSIG